MFNIYIQPYFRPNTRGFSIRTREEKSVEMLEKGEENVKISWVTKFFLITRVD